MIKWEKDLNQALIEQWNIAASVTLKTSKCILHWESSQIITWLVSHTKKVSKSLPKLICRCNWYRNTHLVELWRYSFQLIAIITKIKIKPDPALALLNLNLDLGPEESILFALHSHV